MSSAAEQDFAEALVRQTTELLARSLVSVKGDITADKNRIEALQTEVNSLRGENKELRERIKALEERNTSQSDSAIENLTKRVKTLEDENGKSTVTDKLTRAFKAAVTAINLDQSSYYDHMDNNLSAESGCSPAFMTSTPISRPQQAHYYTSKAKKRKTMEKTSTSTYITDLEQVDKSIRESVRPFYVTNPRASNDLLNQLQRAFIKWQAKKVMLTGESINKALTARIIKEGIEHQLWDTQFNPSDTEPFDAYMLNRLKNERRGLRNQAVLATQEEMLSEYLSKSVQSVQSESILPELC